MVVYIIHRLHHVISNNTREFNGMLAWVKDNQKLLWVLFGISMVMTVYGFLYLPGSLKVGIVLCSIVLAAYIFPLPLFGPRRLRDIGLVKIFLIALLWAVTTAWLPLIGSGKEVPYLQLLARFVFIFSITLPFDIRDMDYDKLVGIRTIPILLGVEVSKNISMVCLVLFVGLSFVEFMMLAEQPGIFIAMLLSAIAAATLVMRTNKANKDLYYLGLVDGTILLQVVLVWIGK